MKPISRTFIIALFTATFLCNCAPNLEVRSHRSVSKSKIDDMRVLPTLVGSNSTEEESLMLNEVEGILHQLGFKVVDRESVSHLIKENEFSLTGLTSKSNRVELGKLINGNALAKVEYSDVKNMRTKALFFKLQNLETLETHYTFSVKNTSNPSTIFWILIGVFFVLSIILGVLSDEGYNTSAFAGVSIIMAFVFLFFGMGSCVRENKGISINHYLHLLEKDLAKQWNNATSEGDKN